MTLVRLLCWFFLLSVIIACSNLAPPAQINSDWESQRSALEDLDSWQLRGRVNVRYNDESNTPRIQWMQQNVEYHIRLWGTFNAGKTVIMGRPGYVTLEQGGDVRTAASPEDLILQQLGYELPVSYLEYWIKGIPAPGSQADLRFNELNQLVVLAQDGWTITYSDLRQYENLSLPRQVEVSRPQNDIRLRFVGLNWQLGGAESDA
jgi:outer membrane lipoprotein LolB|tara:strand:+ start:120 stop:734 length:615 start_codon:yes stop_codon:yes gene_type:complete